MSIYQTLEKYGFDQKEAKIYDFILHNGDSTALEVSRGTGLPRTSVYNGLESLREQGFISPFKKNSTSYFQLESVSNFLRKIKEKEEAIKLVFPEIENLAYINSLDSKPKVKFYQGEESIKKVLDDLLETFKAKNIKEYFSTSDPEFLNLLSPEMFNWYITAREKLGVKAYVILSEQTRKNHRDYLPDNPLRETRYLTGPFNLPAFMFIYGDKVAFFSLKNKRFHSIIIESKTIKDTLLQFFMFAWGTLESAK